MKPFFHLLLSLFFVFCGSFVLLVERLPSHARRIQQRDTVVSKGLLHADAMVDVEKDRYDCPECM